jgi:tetratricopeptide (TPR) repeat protein
MKPGLKVAIFAVLLVCSCCFGYSFTRQYGLMMDFQPSAKRLEVADAASAGQAQPSVFTPNFPKLLIVGAFFFVSVLGLGLFIAREAVVFIGGRTAKALYGDEGEGMPLPEYELAEEAWANGNYIEAIQRLREFLQKNPRAQHAAIRIAEIYEKDLQNYLAAALEYEEVLKQKLDPETWGWSAIHLSNLYSGRLSQPAKAVALLRRIEAEYGQTSAADKARHRLALYDSAGEGGLQEEASS